MNNVKPELSIKANLDTNRCMLCRSILSSGPSVYLNSSAVKFGRNVNSDEPENKNKMYVCVCACLCTIYLLMPGIILLL